MANNLDAFVPEVWSKQIIQKIDQINVMLPFANRDYEGEIRQQGDTVNVRTFGNVNLFSYQRGGGITDTDLTPIKESLTINDAKGFQIVVDDLDKVQNDIDAMAGYTERAAVALNNEIERKLLSYYSLTNSSNRVTNGGSAYTVSASNAYTLLVDAAKTLDEQNVPAQDRWAVLTPTYKAFLNKDTTYSIRATELGDQIVMDGAAARSDAPGYFGTYAGFKLYMSTQVPTTASGRYCQFGQGKRITYASQLRNMEAIRLERTFGTAVRGLMLHDGTVFTENAKAFGYILIGAAQ